MKRIGSIAGLATAAVLALMLVAPAVVDWNAYKPEIARRAGTALGRGVAIDGDVSLALLPRPALAAHAVRLGNLAGAQPDDMARIETVKINLSALSLVLGRVKIASVTLVKPDIVLERLPDGRTNWTFTKPAKPDAAAPSSEAPSVGTPSGASAFPVDSLTIQGGSVVYRTPTTEQRLTQIDGRVAAGGLAGPVDADIRATVQGVEMAVAASLGRFDDGRPAAVEVVARLPRAGAQARLSGKVSGLPDQPAFVGKFSAGAETLAKLVAAVAGPDAVPPGLRGGLALDGNVTADAHQATVADLTARVGQTQGHGSAAVGFGPTPQISAALGFSHLDLDQLLAVKAKAAPPATPAPTQAPLATPVEAPPAAQDAAAAVGAFTVPRGLDVALALAADTVTWRGAALEHAHLNAALAGGEITITQASALLPGATEASVFGFIGAERGRPILDLTVEASSDSLRDLATWAGADLAAVPAERLRAFRAAFKLAGSPTDLRLGALDARLDGAHLTGAANLRLGERVAFGATLALDQLDLDAYLPPPAPAAAPAAPPAGKTAGAKPAAAAARPDLALVASFDASVKARLGQLVYNGVTVRDLSLDGTLLKGDLTLREAAVGDLGGAAARVSGAVLNLTGAPVLKSLRYDLRTRQPAAVAKLLHLALPVAPEKLGAVVVAGTVDGTADGVDIVANGEAAGLSVGLRGKVLHPLAQPQFDLTAEASHANWVQVLRLVNDTYRPAVAGGGVAVSAKLRGDAQSLEVADLRLRLGAINAAGSGHVAFGPHPRVATILNAGEVDLTPFLPAKHQTTAEPWPDGKRAPPSAAPPAAKSPAKPAPSERWSRAAIDLAWLRDVDASVQLDAHALTVDKIRVDGVRLSLAVADAALVVEKASGQMFGGTVGLTARLGADGAAAGTVSVAKSQIKPLLAGLAGIGVAQGLLDANATLAATGHAPADWVATLAGAGQMAVHDGVISGFDLKAASQRVNAIDNVQGLLGLVQAGLSGGQTRFSNLSGTFKAEAGVVTSTDLRLDAEGGTGDATAVVNLPAYTLDTDIHLHLAGAADAPALGLKLQGPLDNPRKVFDINALQQFLASRGLGRLFKGGDKGVGGLLQGLLAPNPKAAPRDPVQSAPLAAPTPPQPATPPPAPQQPTQPEPKPEKLKAQDVLRGLFKAFGGK